MQRTIGLVFWGALVLVELSGVETSTSSDVGAEYDNVARWPSGENRPALSGRTLSWIGPVGGGASTTEDRRQSAILGLSLRGMIISKPGDYVGLNLQDTLIITASNVTVRASYIESKGPNVVTVNAPGIQNVVIEDSEIVGGGVVAGVTGQNGVFIANNLGGGITVRRCNIHGVGSGVASGDAPYTIIDNYIHDLAGAPATHFNGLQDNGHTTHDGQPVIIRHNVIDNSLQNQTDALMLDNWGDLTNVSVDNNLLLGAGITAAGVVYVDGSIGKGAISVALTNNHVGPNVYGNHVFVRRGSASSFNLTHHGNIDAATLESIDPTF